MAPKDTNRYHGRCKAIYIGGNLATAQELHPLLLHHFPFCAAVQLPSDPSPQDLAAALQSSVPSLCVLDVGELPDAANGLLPELLRLDPQLGILTVLPTNHPDLILPCLRLGAIDFLTIPFMADKVQAAAQKLIRLFPALDSASSSAKIYCVLPAKGACGATTIACNLAFQWQRLTSAPVLLADLDPFAGTVGFLLKVKSTFSFVDVLSRAADMDSDLWKAMIINRYGVDVLLAPELPLDVADELLDAGAILDYARCHYPVIVSDAGSAIAEWSLSQAHLSDEVLLISTNDVASLHAAQRVLEYLENNGIGRWKIKLILNRFDERFGVSRELVEDALGSQVFHVLPADDPAVQRSLMEGKPVAHSSRLGKSLASLILRLSGQEAVRKPSSFAGLMALFSRSSS
jgi:pilus assembly protein CpaE